ncbi:hypothetical protein C8R44DRAFT_873640 [Mycena epipterygia]|nr:hypothetical protein C8R44DRAFT_873640 [Mycena epipterygia]
MSELLQDNVGHGALHLTLPDSVSFRIPEAFLDGNLSLPALWDYHRAHSGGHPLYIYEDEEQPHGITQIMWSQAIDAMYRAAQFLKPFIDAHTTRDAGKQMVVGMLSYRDVPTSCAIFTAILRLGATAFMISPTNSPTMLANILRDAKCTLLVTGNEKAIGNLVRTATNVMDEDHIPLIIQGPSFQELYLSVGGVIDSSELPEVVDLDAPAFITHSSGSSNGTPSLVTSTHRALVHQSIMTYFGDKDLCGCVCGAQSFPLFHPTGISAYVAVPSATGQVSTIFNPLHPPKPTTADNVLKSAVVCNAYFLYTLPSFIEAWSRSTESIQGLRRFETILFAGSPLKPNVGNYMAQQGLRLSSMYGTSESGAVSAIRFGGEPEDWEYIQPTRQTTILWEPRAEGLFEPAVLESKYKHIPKPNIQRLGRPACQTGDLFEKHPTKDDLWRVYGRSDARIIHSTGEKTDPIAIETVISKHPLVQYAIVFGQGRPRAGVLIWPHFEQVRLDIDNVQSLREDIWSAVEEANQSAPSHSRIIKETMIIATPAKPFSLTDKRSLRRGTILLDYSEEISAVFDALEEAAVSSLAVPPPSSWAQEDILSFVRSTIGRVQMGSSSDLPKDGDDLFEHGLDSLQVPLVRNALAQGLMKTGIDCRNLESNMVYTHPTISSLAQFISGYASKQNQAVQPARESKAIVMRSMLTEFTSPFPLYSSNGAAGERSEIPEDIILITGSTGTLGSHVLAVLLDNPGVTRIYVLNRISKGHDIEAMRARQTTAFGRQGIPEIYAKSPKISYLAGDITVPGLGLNPAIQQKMRGELTGILHNAWAVNFLQPLASFRPLLQSLRNMLEFALSCDRLPKFMFMSTISVAHGWSEITPVPERALSDPSPAIGMGYSESKWVAEQMIHFTRETTSLKPMIARLGQLCASNSHAGGRWNSNEWFPLIVRSGAKTTSLPLLTGDVSWIPVNFAASAIVDLMNTPESFECANIVHPRPVIWTTILEPLAEALGVPLVLYKEWLSKLQQVAATENARETPAIALLDIFMSQGVTDESTVFIDGAHKFELEHVRAASPIFAQDGVPALSRADVLTWLRHWNEVDARGKADRD